MLRFMAGDGIGGGGWLVGWLVVCLLGEVKLGGMGDVCRSEGK